MESRIVRCSGPNEGTDLALLWEDGVPGHENDILSKRAGFVEINFGPGFMNEFTFNCETERHEWVGLDKGYQGVYAKVEVLGDDAEDAKNNALIVAETLKRKFKRAIVL